jgi:peptidoglycan/LPS O-acetylase OafA/YrhL
MSALAGAVAWRAALARRLGSRTLAQAYDEGVDNFLLLRLLAAIFVIFGHSYAVSGKPHHGDFIARAGWGNGIYTGSIAVDMFFVVSGFLVSGSYVKRANLLFFLKSRALRILPAHVACMFLSAFVLGAIFTELPLFDYLLAPDTRKYFLTNIRLGSELIWGLPGVFAHNFQPNVVNGSIWTLPTEVRMYAWVAILGVCGVLRRRWLANMAFALLFVLGTWAPHVLPLMFHNPWQMHLVGAFLAGGIFYINRDWIPLHTAWLVALIVLAILTHTTLLFPYTFCAALAYFCFWFAYIPNFHFFNRFGDYSYGVYLWGYPVQQAVSFLIGGTARPRWNFLVSLPIALALAVASWHFIEKPALRLKGKTRSTQAESAPAQ